MPSVLIFKNCKCGHYEEDHAMNIPEGEGEHNCNVEGCTCRQFEEAEDEDK